MNNELMAVVEKEYHRIAAEELIRQKIDLLNWVIQLTGSGMTNGMIRKHVHNKIVELSGKGEMA